MALKEIQPQYADHAISRTRFLREAEITGNLEHPGIVPVYGIGQYDDGRPYYAMRFIKGNSLKEAIDRFHEEDRSPGRNRGERTLEFRKLLGRFIDVCNAIEYAHSRGILHRDLKPGNVMLGKYGETLVVDWGLAKSTLPATSADSVDDDSMTLSPNTDADPTQMGNALGTPAFMSPEQARGKLDEIGPASDVYSLGATLYCLLTGRPPFTGSDDILGRVARGDFKPPRSHSRWVPRPLEAISLRAMSLRPGERYQSPKAIADEIGKWLADEPVDAYGESWGERMTRWRRRHRAWAFALSVAASVITVISLLAVCLVTVAWTRESDQRRRTERALDAITLTDIARRVSTSPTSCQVSLDEFKAESRDYPWHLVRRAAGQHHRAVEIPGIVSQSWLSPAGNHLFFSVTDKKFSKTSLWMYHVRSGAAPIQILDDRQFRRITGSTKGFSIIELDLPAEHLIRARFVDDGQVLTYSMADQTWVPAQKSELSQTRSKSAAPGNSRRGETFEVDGKPQRLLAIAPLEDGRVFGLLPGKESSSGLDSSHRFLVGKVTEDPRQIVTTESFSMDALPLITSFARLSSCREAGKVVLHDGRTATTFDLDNWQVHKLDALTPTRPMRVVVAKSGNKVALVHLGRKIADKTQIFVTIVDNQGKTLFQASHNSPNLKRQAAEQGITGNESLSMFRWSSPQGLQFQFSADEESFSWVEPDYEAGRSLINVCTPGEEGIGVPWKAHSNPIIAADLVQPTGEIVTVDNKGGVRNWKDGGLRSQWTVPNLSGVASIVARNNSLLVLTWDTDPTVPFGTGVWSNRVAVVSGQVYDRQTGAPLCSVPEVRVMDPDQNRPQSALKLSPKELRLLPFLSSDGSKIGWLIRDDAGIRIQCKEVDGREFLVDRKAEDPLMARFNPSSETVLLLSRKGKAEFAVEEILLRDPDSSTISTLKLSARASEELNQPSSVDRLLAVTGLQLDLWTLEASIAWLELDVDQQRARAWAPLLNWSGRMDMANLREFPLVLEVGERYYLDFRHKTQEIRLRRRKGQTIVREFKMPFPLSKVWAVLVDDSRTLLTMGPDRVLHFWALDSGDRLGTVRLPFAQLDGLTESRDHRQIIFWGDNGKLLALSTSRER